MSCFFFLNLSRTLESKKKGNEKPLCNSFCNENPWVHPCCWPMSANPGNGTSLVLKEEYKSFKVHNKHFTISPACRLCYCNLCRHNWIQHFIVFVYSTSIAFYNYTRISTSSVQNRVAVVLQAFWAQIK